MTAANALLDAPLALAPSPEPSPLRLVPPLPPGPAGVWWVRIPRRVAAPAEHSLLAVASDRFPAGTRVDLRALDARGRRPAGWLVDVRYRAADGTVVRIDARTGPGAPDGTPRPRPCFTEVHHAGAAMPAVTLHACTGVPGIPAGALLAPGRVPRGATRVGSVRWWIRSGLVDAVRVEPAFRGCGYGRLLVHAAEGLRSVRGWAPLRADGRLTDAAAAWLGAAPACWAPRLAARTRHLAPEAEPGSLTGVQRLIGDLPSRLI